MNSEQLQSGPPGGTRRRSPRRAAALLLAYGTIALAQTPAVVTVRVADETAPPGGVAQIKVEVTDPKPITSGDMAVFFDAGLLDEVLGVALFSPAGDVSGVAVYQGNLLRVRFTSPLGRLGLDPDYPILAIAAHVSSAAPVGAQAPLELGLGSWWTDLFGQLFPVELRPGTLTVTGKVSIDDVVPGGGFVAAGSTITIHGRGFEPGVRVKIGSFLLSPAVVTPNSIQVVMQTAGRLDGSRVRVVNDDGSQDEYFSYDRGHAFGRSQHPVAAATVPIFSDQVFTAASLTLAPGTVTGLAISNPNKLLVQVDIEVAPGSRGSAVIPPGMRLVRELSELVPGQTAGEVRVRSSLPVHLLGFVSDGVSVVPVAALSTL